MSTPTKSAQIVAEALESLNVQLHLATQILDGISAASVGGSGLQEDPDYIPPDTPANITPAELDSLRQRELGAYNDLMFRLAEQRNAYDTVESHLEELLMELDEMNAVAAANPAAISTAKSDESKASGVEINTIRAELECKSTPELEQERAQLLESVREKNRVLRECAMRAADIRQQILAYTASTHNPTLRHLTDKAVQRHSTKLHTGADKVEDNQLDYLATLVQTDETE